MANFYGSFIGFGAGGAAAALPFYLGESFGYIYGGTNAGPMVLTMEKHSMTADTDATEIGNMAVGRTYMGSCTRSETHGYTVGGYISAYTNIIEKWQFSTDGDCADVANLVVASAAIAGASHVDYCYSFAGKTAANHIQRFATASDVDATDVGDCPQQGSQGGGFSSETHGYKAGGWTSYTNIHGAPTGAVLCIQKVQFVSTADAVDIAHLSTARSGRVSSCSETHGYCGPGYGGTTVIGKYSFASEDDEAVYGGTAVSNSGTGACATSANNGYFGFGTVGNTSINKYSHISEANSVNIGDINTERLELGGCHS